MQGLAYTNADIWHSSLAATAFAITASTLNGVGAHIPVHVIGSDAVAPANAGASEPVSCRFKGNMCYVSNGEATHGRGRQYALK